MQPGPENTIPLPAARESVDPALVAVFDTHQESEAMVVRGLLQSAGIEALVSSLQAPQDVLPGVGGVIVQVSAEQADQARRLIEEYRVSGPLAPDDPEPPLTEDPAA